jgi:hypothetical protein
VEELMGLRAWAERKAMGKILAYAVKAIAEGKLGELPKRLYWRLAGAKTYIGMAFGAAWALLTWGTESGTCGKLGYDCTAWANTLGVIAAFLMAVGLFDGALRTKAPDKFAGLVALLCVLVGTTACGQLQLETFPKRPLGVDQGVVEGLVCRGELKQAEVYAQDRGASRAEVTERVQRAVETVAHKPGCCAGPTCSAQGGK